MRKGHITKEERFCIEKLLTQHTSYRKVAGILGRGVSTICDEVNRNGGRDAYNAEKAHHHAYLRQYRKKRNCNKVAMSGFLTRYIEKHLVMLWSPERISGRLLLEYGMCCSAKSIRKFIKKRGGLERFLFWHRVRKKSGYKRGSTKKLAERTFIDDRPEITSVGHWEGDFIVSRKSKEVLLVLTDKVSRYSKVQKLSTRRNDVVNHAISSMLSEYEKRSLTLDNDIAFQSWKQLPVSVYFTHPYCSWEKGLVENTNRWIRSFLPKRTNFSEVSEETIQRIEDWLNHTPRQCLGYRTSYEVHFSK